MNPPPRTESVGPESGRAIGRIELIAGGTEIAHRFEVRDVLGTGGYAVVYRAFDRALSREVALKVLRPDRLSPTALLRLRREAAVARDVVHPRIVRIFDIEEVGETVFLAMEVVEGGSLGQRMSRGPMEIDEAVAWATQALEGLAALHALGIVHRDVKPGNLLLTAEGALKVSDFGLALQFDRDETRATTHESVLGTLEYISPEQALGASIDMRSDLYSLGVVLFEMLAGRLPFEAQSSLGALLERLRHESLPDLRSLRPETPAWLAAVVARLLERNPERRYLSAEAALSDLRNRSARQRIRPRRGPILVAVAASLAIATVWGVQSFRLSRFSHVVPVGTTGIAAIDSTGRTLWSRERRHQMLNFQTVRLPGGRPALAAFDEDVDVRLTAGTSWLDLLDPQTGERISRHLLPSGHSSFAGFSDSYTPMLNVFDLDSDGVDEVIATFVHSPFYPSYNVLYEPSAGRSRVVFLSAGHHRPAGAVDVDGDGRSEVLFVGIANRMGWANALAAVRVSPWIDELTWDHRSAARAASPDLDLGVAKDGLVWYALLPAVDRIPPGERVRVDETRKEIALDIGTTTYRLTFEGFLRDHLSTLARGARSSAREAAYLGMLNGQRMLAVGQDSGAIATLERAQADAERANDQALAEWLAQRTAFAMVRAGLVEEGIERFDLLWKSVPAPSEVAYAAGMALHGRGLVSQAVAWYRRALGPGARLASGRNKGEILDMLLLALAELGQRDQALLEIDRHMAAYPAAGHIEARGFIDWYFGGSPDPGPWAPLEQLHDLYRYWRLEVELRHGTPPETILTELAAARAAASETSPLLDSLEAELLFRLGRTEEALPLARRGDADARLRSTDKLFLRAFQDLLAQRLEKIERAAATHPDRPAGSASS